MAQHRWRQQICAALAVAALLLVGVARVPVVPAHAKDLFNPRGMALDARNDHLFVLPNWYRRSGEVRMLDARTGTLLHAAAVGLDPSAIAVDARADRVFVLNGSNEFPLVPGRLDMLDAATGVPLRTLPLGTTPLAMALDQQTNRLFVAINGPDNEGYNARVLMVNATDGRILRSVAVGHFPSAMTVDEHTGRVFVAGDYRVLMLDATSGTLLRTIGAGTHPLVAIASEQTDRVFLLGAEGRDVDILDAATGNPLTTLFIGDGCLDLALDSIRRQIIVPCVSVAETAGPSSLHANGRLLFLDAATGKVLQTIDLRVPPMSAVVAPRLGHLFVLDNQQSNEDTLLMLDARTGRQIAATRVQGWPGAALVDDADGRAFVASTAGVIMLDARTGAVLKMTALPSGSNG